MSINISLDNEVTLSDLPTIIENLNQHRKRVEFREKIISFCKENIITLQNTLDNINAWAATRDDTNPWAKKLTHDRLLNYLESNGFNIATSQLEIPNHENVEWMFEAMWINILTDIQSALQELNNNSVDVVTSNTTNSINLTL